MFIFIYARRTLDLDGYLFMYASPSISWMNFSLMQSEWISTTFLCPSSLLYLLQSITSHTSVFHKFQTLFSRTHTSLFSYQTTITLSLFWLLCYILQASSFVNFSISALSNWSLTLFTCMPITNYCCKLQVLSLYFTLTSELYHLILYRIA
jgi:hypothetical protein